jgi:hypothetical protein
MSITTQILPLVSTSPEQSKFFRVPVPAAVPPYSIFALSASTQPANIQWTLNYPAASVANVIVSPMADYFGG